MNARNGISFHNRRKPGTNEKLPPGINEDEYGSRWGNAKEWLNAAVALGYTVNSTPCVGAVYYHASGGYGHVAWVSNVNGNKVTIEQYNAGFVTINGKQVGDHKFSSKEFVVGSKGEKYIHIKDLENNANNNGRFDVNFNVDGHDQVDINGIGAIGVYIDGQRWDYQGSNTYADFCRSDVPVGKPYEVRVSIHDPNYWCAGTIEGSFKGTTSSNTVVRLDITSSVYDRVLPDGDYLIATAGASQKSTFFYLDIAGTAQPASSGTNVALCGPLSGDPPSYEIWTIRYNQGFYTIKQCGTGADICLGVENGSNASGANVGVYTGNNSSAQKWAITHNNRNGYRLQAKCSGLSLDVEGAAVNTNGTNVRQWSVNSSDAQSWLFIPYKPSQPLAEGRYILLSGVDNSWEIDVPGDTGDIADKTPVQLWSDDVPSQNNSFDVTKLNNGYYKLTHVVSGKVLEVYGGGSDASSRASLMTDNGSNAQQWAITKDGYNDGYCLRVKTSGYVLHLMDANLSIRAIVRQYPWIKSRAGTWVFVPAEYTIRYNLNDGTGTSTDQTKYYKTDLSLSSTVPVRPGYIFMGWGTSADDLNPVYQPGAIYAEDNDLTLYAIWRSNKYTVSYDANGGTGAPPAQTYEGSAATLSTVEPSRAHYRFLGWATSAAAETATHAPGSVYEGGIDVTFYAVWQRKLESVMVLPRALTVIESEAFLGTAADAFVVPVTVTSIGNNAFDDVAIYGYSGSYAQTYANDNGLTFIPITEDWVLEDDVPEGANVIGEKWTYTLTTTETKTSTASSISGWTQTGYTWQQSGTGTWKYASYPGGFDTGNSLYGKYNKSALSSNEQATTKRVVGSSSLATYIYWHWTFVDTLNSASDSSNVLVEDAKKYQVLTANVYRDYIYFDAFESTTNYGTVGPGTNGNIDVSPMRYAWRGVLGDVSHWWWRFEVYQQTYTDYSKLFSYVRNKEEIKESMTEVVPGDGITNVQHWVKYEF